LTTRWLIRRVGFMLLVILIALIINFIIPRLMPGGAKEVYTTGAKLPLATQAAMIKKLGLDKSIWEQFILYIKNTFTGDLGFSYADYPTTVTSKLATALPWTLFLLIFATVLTVPVGYILGVIAGWRAGSKRDSTIQAFSLALLATPLFWIAMVLLYLFGYQLDWFPMSGAEEIYAQTPPFFSRLGDILYHAILPTLALMTAFGSYELIMRNTMVTTLREQYVTTAEAKGLSENAVKYRHAARNSLLPLVTTVGIRFATIVGGSIFVEKIFSYPGIGNLTFNAVLAHDYPVLQGSFLIYSLVTIVVVFLLDLVYLRLDPRIKY